jgi:hypothetical protein
MSVAICRFGRGIGLMGLRMPDRPSDLKPHSAGERVAILQRLGLDPSDPASHAFAVASGWIRTDPPYVPSPWPRPPRDAA